ncbi:hypothetical protein CcaCcLH18_03739 [Colletotrichum camelliae]|nr:hypothetical protein CcaCcLH18_03739 [Colletotrichum camelliae]
MRYPATYRLDPDGDVELILRNPDAPFAVWDDSEDAAVQDLSAWYVMTISNASGTSFADDIAANLNSSV